MGRPKAMTDAGAALSALDDEVSESQGSRTQVAILVALFVGISGLTGAAIQLGAFGGASSTEFGWTQPRGVDPKGVARAKSLKAGKAATIDSLLEPVTDGLLEQALGDLPEPEAVAIAAPDVPAEAPAPTEDVYHDLRDADGQPIPSTDGAKPIKFGGMPAPAKAPPRAAAAAPAGPPPGPEAKKAETPRGGAGARPTDALLPESVGAALGAARRQLGSGAPEAAVEGFRAVLANDANNSKARLGLAQALFESNRITEARGEVKRLLESEPTHGRALLMMASIAQEQGPASEAKAYYKLYLKHYPNGTSAPEVRAILDRL
jgi:TolA-binding protein